YEQDDRRFTSQAWNKLFKIKEQVVREYVMEFLSSFTFRDHVEELDVADTRVFQLGGGKEEHDHETVHPGSWHIGKEKVNLDDLFLLHSMDGGVSVDVPWHVAKFLCDKSKGYNGLGIGEMVAEIPEVAANDDVGAGQAKIGGVRRHPNNMTSSMESLGSSKLSRRAGYSTAPFPSASQFGNSHPFTSRNQDDMNED
ncbi:hypothetical protein Tco_0671604, partial [Tanacetum coccineum]